MNVWVPRPAFTAFWIAERTSKPTPAAGQPLYPWATVAEATTPPRLTPAQAFQKALAGVRVVDGAYTFTVLALQE
jgi:hypothetical protein